jgi:hypothetical protein
MEDPQTPIELHADSEGRYYLRIDDRVGYMNERYAKLPSKQEVIARFHDDADEFLDGEWSLDEYEAEGGRVEDFDAWQKHYALTEEKSGARATSHVATHQA